jgi:hypothetical protein
MSDDNSAKCVISILILIISNVGHSLPRVREQGAPPGQYRFLFGGQALHQLLPDSVEVELAGGEVIKKHSSYQRSLSQNRCLHSRH